MTKLRNFFRRGYGPFEKFKIRRGILYRNLISIGNLVSNQYSHYKNFGNVSDDVLLSDV